ncbi:hypothetical protein BABINDRAFT_118021 [Babjeviella inositovora NRRL Y-12698]|uniref:TauD/TfdA-like domain-containing protein n=1 Tax=Babjeviella inositovora NRRL Y-12698 TaxID=984486 RepID=A0A1E3QT78_9ASCO|nr:uncharacterized protein BABINDRAFT_118021 [Babjeviella inositovora NRRL Y-12698]ODQ80899.1 hypothetical protein BABINDRAFT_118021 [Babjeviella inositovora NRRL Y-12698]
MSPPTATTTDEIIHSLKATNLNNIADEGKEILVDLTKGKPAGGYSPFAHLLPAPTLARYKKYGIDTSKGYPEAPPQSEIPTFVDEAYAVRSEGFLYVERGKNADPEKKALFGAATEVRHLTKHIGTEIVGLQLQALTDQQRDELALLIAERVVVFFRDQDLSPQKQLELGEYYGQVEKHPQAVHVPGLPGITIIWPEYYYQTGVKNSFKRIGYTGVWHTDLVHEHQPAGITHLHNDTIPEVGGDTVWSSGYAAYDKLSPALQKFLDGKKAVYVSAHSYFDRNDPLNGKKRVEREHPIVRTHPVTGWKSLYLNRAMTDRIVGLEPGESKVLLEYLFGVFEKNLDIQVRFNWKPTKKGLGTSALWDNRVSQHNAIWDYENTEPRHGTRVTSLADLPHFDPESKSQRQSLGLSLD